MGRDQPQYANDSMLTRVELAKALNISTRTIDTWIAEGTGPPYHRLGRSIRYRWGDVQDWLRERRVDG